MYNGPIIDANNYWAYSSGPSLILLHYCPAIKCPLDRRPL